MNQQRPAHHVMASLTDDDHVTGEGVALDLAPASLGLRIASGLIDVVFTIVLFVCVLIACLIAAVRTDEALFRVALVGAMIISFLVVPTVTETLTRGRSLGKLAFGLRTVRDDAGPISFQHAFVRALIGFVEIYAASGAAAFFSAMLSAKGKRLGDHAAGTYVVRERVRLELAPPAIAPPHLVEWARSADMAGLPSGLAIAVRQFLRRQASLDPRIRDDIGGRLAAQVLAYVAPAPPPAHPVDVLSAVLAGRRERDLARLQREAQLRARLTSSR